MSDSLCKACGAKIRWIRTFAGKNMPVEPDLEDIDEFEEGDSLVTESGITYRKGADFHARHPDVMMAYMPHWAFCSKPNDFRRKR
jgi:hypothetical protein